MTSRGRFAMVLHSHLPWLSHHGAWPVGEEWLHQAVTASYIPLLDMLHRLGERDRRNLVTMGVTPVLAAQWDDPHNTHATQQWCADWQLRAAELAHRNPVAGERESRAAGWVMNQLQTVQRNGLSTSWRRLADAGVVELLGGPATHPFQPLVDERVVEFGLRVGLDDHHLRFGQRPAGIWAPECGYRPGIEAQYQQAGVTHFMMDGPTMLHVGRDTAAGWRVGDSDVVAFGRDLSVTYRVWSPRRGYPGDAHYRDFHAVDHLGFRTRQVTSSRIHGADKSAYDPRTAWDSIERHAQDFVQVVAERLDEKSAVVQDPLVVAAYDTELFGHWWHEGPRWLERVFELLPQAGVEIVTLAQAVTGEEARIDPEPGSWGSGKDWRVWAGAAVTDVVNDNEDLQRRWLKLAHDRPAHRDLWQDQLAREALLALSSDWAFMITKDSAAQYALERHHGHHAAFEHLAAAIETGRRNPAVLADSHAVDYPFAHLDARLLRL